MQFGWVCTFDVDALMQYCQCMKSYLSQLQAAAAPTGIDLLQFFKQAGVPTSTYYRAIQGQDMRLSTAQKVEDAVTSYSLHRAETQYD